MSKVTLMGVGDIILDLDNHDSAFTNVKHILRQGDVVFANCDQSFSDLGDSPNSFWPIYVSAVPHAASMADCVADAGFTILNFGNNHSLDWGYEAAFDCLDQVKKRGMTPFGFGKNITEARKPAIIEKEGSTIGFLNYCSIGPEGYEATEHRPGHTPMRVHTYYDQWDPQPGTPAITRTFPNRDDLAALLEDVRSLRDKVDVLVCTFHWGVHYVLEVIADYEKEVAHAAIDAGADLVFGQHAHLPKGIEVYNGKAILYGMHNFCSPGEWMPPAKQPGSKYPESYKWDWTEHGEKFKSLFGDVDPEEKRQTLIARVTIDDGDITRVAYTPCWLNDRNEPTALKADDPRATNVFEHFKKISKSQGFDTEFQWEDDEIVLVI